MMYCPNCRRDVEPDREHLPSGQVTYRCSNCAERDPSSEPAILAEHWWCNGCGGEKQPIISLNGASQMVRQCPDANCNNSFGGALSKSMGGVKGFQGFGESGGDGSNEARPVVDLTTYQNKEGATAFAAASWLRQGRAAQAAQPQATPRANAQQPRPGSAPLTQPMAPTDVIGMVRGRLATLQMEKVQLEGEKLTLAARIAALKLEEKQLGRMVAAADRVVAQQLALTSVSSLLASSPDTSGDPQPN